VSCEIVRRSIPCDNRCTDLITYSFAGLLSAGAMGFWHGVEYYEKERVVGDEFYQQWSNVSRIRGATDILACPLNNNALRSVFRRCSRRTPVYRTTGRSSWLGPASGFLWCRLYCSPARPFVCEANASEKKRSTCNTWCPVSARVHKLLRCRCAPRYRSSSCTTALYGCLRPRKWNVRFLVSARCRIENLMPSAATHSTGRRLDGARRSPESKKNKKTKNEYDSFGRDRTRSERGENGA